MDTRPGKAATQSPPPPDAPRGEPNRLVVLGRLVWLCFTPFAMVLLGNLMLALPQIREGLWAFDDGEGGAFDGLRRQTLFVLAFAFWAATAWYVARLTLGRRFPDDDVGSVLPGVTRIAKWLPRLLGLAACLPLALYTLGTGKHPVLSAVLVVVSGAFLVFTWQRRRLFDMPEEGHYRYFERLSRGSWRTLALGFALPWALMAAIVLAPIEVGRWVGAPALLLWAIGGWTLFGGMVLSYAPRARGWISLVWLPAGVLVALSPWNNNHPVDWLAHQHSAGLGPPPTLSPRPELKAHYEAWIQGHAGNEPVYLVANAGGASRAAYWGAVALGQLEDEARQAGQRFGANIFLMSGISGGSVGLAAYAAALRAWPAAGKVAAPCIQPAVSQFLAKDVLSPVGGLMLYPDLLLRFLPLGMAGQPWDRSRGLEQAWAQDWAELVAQPPKGCPAVVAGSAEAWRQPLVQAFAAAPGHPALALNTARLEDSRPVVQATVDLGLPDADDLLGPGLAGGMARIRVAGAAHNSARFPLVSPPGTVQTAREGVVWGHLGDGGYHEVSGAATLVGVLERLLALGCLRQDPSPATGQAPSQLVALKTCGPNAAGPGSRVVVVLLDGSPQDFPPNWQRDHLGVVRDWGQATRNEVLRPRQPVRVPEVLGPLVGLASHGSQARRMAEDQLSALAGTDPHGLVALRLPRYAGQREPSMNWQLDDESRRLMDCALAPAGSTACARGADVLVLRPQGLPASMADAALLSGLARLRASLKAPQATGAQP